jgi:diguanylate cyclase
MYSLIDTWPLVLSFFSMSIAVLIAFEFVSRIYKSSENSSKGLLISFALFTGTGVWANHLLISLAFHHAKEFNHSPSMLLAGWVFSSLLGYIALKVASKNHFNLIAFVNHSIIAGACVFMLFYCTLIAMHDATQIGFKLEATLFALILSALVCFIISLLVFWIRNYIGEYPILVKIIFACIASTSILATHLSLNNATVVLNSIVHEPTGLLNNQLAGTIIALSVVCVFLLAFVVILFYEKFGNAMFSFKLFSLGIIDKHASHSEIDSLTELPNRKGFLENLKTAINHSSQNESVSALAYIDLDHFKPINDKYGHHIGDAVLVTVAHRLQAAIREGDTAARLGGDEFAAIIKHIEFDKDITPIVDRIVSSIGMPFFINGQQIEISCSVGVAIYPRDGDIEKLMISADSAMYKAKANGRNQFKIYDAELESASNNMQMMQADLLAAIARNQFSLLFQPKLDCKTHLFAGAEALIRWNHPTKGVILPKEFIPVAEHLGLIDQINDWVMQEACRTIGRAKAKGVDLNVSINLSKQAFRNKHLVNQAVDYIAQFGASAENLTIEIKETSGVRDEALFNQLIAQFKAANIRITLDDFGLHPFTLNYLQDLNVDEIKIDKIFVSRLTSNAESWKLVDVLINLAHTLHINVVAEGIENETQSNVLTQLGCNHMQGYLFSAPIVEADLHHFYKQRQLIFNYT